MEDRSNNVYMTFEGTEKSGSSDDIGALPEWNLADLYEAPDSPQLEADIARAKRDAETFHASYRGRLAALADGGRGGAALAQAVVAYEALADLLGKISSYAALYYYGDIQDPARAKFFGDCQEILTAINTRLLFFTLEFNRLEDDVLEQCCAEPALAYYRPWIDDLRKEKPYQLDDKIEELFTEKAVTGRAAWNRLFDETMTSLRFLVDGRELSLEPILNLLLDKEEARRRTGFEALSKTFGENLRLFTMITNTLAKDKEISDRWRGYKDIADSRHLANRVERETVEALVSSVRAAYPRLSHRYYKLKAKWYGKDALNSWDRNAPLPNEPARTFSWNGARATVLEAYEGFSGEMASIAREFFDSRWIDAQVREGKTSGAFSHPTVPSVHPYVLMNYQGKPRDVMTLAHELGHGVHQVLAAKQGALMAQTPLTLAETASVFGEMLTFKALLASATDPTERKAMLASKVEDMINTVVRQIAFYSFERDVHQARREGELTSEQINKIWLDVQRESLGEAVTLNEGYEVFWAYIPHFIHAPFYVYAYAFGDCLVNSLYAVYENSADGFSEKYLQMLRAGGSRHHKELLAPFGLDATDPAFWSKGLGVIERLIDELEQMEG